MNRNDILSFVKNNYSSPKSVHERLYNDFSKRRETSSFLMSCGSTFKVVSGSRTEGVKIEDLLLQRMAASKSKLNKLKVKYQTEELKEVRAVPQINQMSRLIAAKSEGKTIDIKNRFLESIVKNSRSLAAKPNTDREIKKALFRISDEKVEVVKEKETRDRALYLNFLRSAVLKRGQLLQHEEPPKLLEMDVIDRGNYWTTLRKQKLERLQKQVQKTKIKDCTFAPELQPRKAYKTVARSLSESKSYSQIYLEKKEKFFLKSPKEKKKKGEFVSSQDPNRLLRTSR